ncbi:glycoside hydrolase family 3 C-terminal domain-containing protein [Streptacidiphilus pinicola]|uniref:glycoside hydrolase family 3 C-terminal domain-containing protein n=1 Tax=Streptacidiphilus pinicola TaxID=2219663 RepID=UPI001A9F9C07|nr:glycoside hydrolase family 3 C-terminal domain-containing protein [Streptacidiphilus pinicola]
MYKARTQAKRRTSALAVLALIAGGAGMLNGAGAANAATAAATGVSAACPWVHSSAPIPQRVSQVLARMTLDQKISLMSGVGSRYSGATPAIGSLCIPATTLADGPAGVGDDNGFQGATQLPAPVDLAATWDTSAERTYGQVIGAEQAAKGATIDLGPTINITRDPRWGRAFETVGEDPYLNGQMGAADILGVQSTGVMAQVKHLAVYNQETNRNTPADNAIVSDQALQEIYLPAFQTAVQQSAPSSVMCSYSTINNTPACQNTQILDSALRKQFGFTGFVTSDWSATQSTVASANAGLDQDMPPGDPYYGNALKSAVTSGQVSQSTIDTSVSRILTQMFAFGQFDQAPTGSPAQPATSTANQSAAGQLAAEGTVLLKNSGNLLPLGASASSIAVIGAASANAMTAGGGSAHVASSGTVTPLDAITARAGSGTTVKYDDGTNTASAAALAASSSVAVVFVNKGESEGWDLGDIDLGSQNTLISAVAAANPNTIVVLNTGSAVTMPWLSSVKGVLEAWYPGQQAGTAIASLLFGDTDPSGHLPVTFPKSLSDVPAATAAQWPGSNGTVQYSEGLDVGYRWYDAKGITPLFPFGYGLSYTSFSFSDLHVGTLSQGGAATVTATVTNTGSRAGADIAQLYLTQPASTGEPPRQLQGFSRVDLQPGQSKTVTFQLTQRNLQHYDSTSGASTTATGDYGISVGDAASDANLPLKGTLTVTSGQLGQPLTLTSPGPQEGPTGTPISVQVAATDTTTGQTPVFAATGLPAGTSVSSTGLITGTPTTPGTSTVTVTAQDAAGALATTTFLWTVVPADAPVATPLIGNGGTCLDLYADNNDDGNKADVYGCNGTAAQQWSEQPDGTVRADGKCLDVAGAGTADGTPVQIYACNGTSAQVWQHQAGGALVNPHSGKCLTDPEALATDGTQAVISACTGAGNQSWVSPVHTIAGVGSGRCVDIPGADPLGAPQLQLYDCNSTAAQTWSQPGDGTIHAMGMCLDVAAASTANGTPVDTYPCNGTAAQRWTYNPTNHELTALGKCLDATGFGTANGTKLQLWDCNDTSNQQWNLP